MTARIITCGACQQRRPHKAHGWCTTCYMRWDRAGRPDTGPPSSTVEPRRKTTCTACGEERDHAAHGWCYPCYFRWYRAGRPDTGPPPPRHVNTSPTEYAYRLDEYAHLRSNGAAPTVACWQLGLNSVTSRIRYERAWKVGA